MSLGKNIFHGMTKADDATRISEENLHEIRQKTMTKNEKNFNMVMLKERRQKLLGRFQRKTSNIEELAALLDRNVLTVEQELSQFKDIHKLCADLHEELDLMLEQ